MSNGAAKRSAPQDSSSSSSEDDLPALRSRTERALKRSRPPYIVPLLLLLPSRPPSSSSSRDATSFHQGPANSVLLSLAVQARSGRLPGDSARALSEVSGFFMQAAFLEDPKAPPHFAACLWIALIWPPRFLVTSPVAPPRVAGMSPLADLECQKVSKEL